MGKGVLRLPVCSPPPSAQAMPSEAPPPPPPTSLSPELAISLLSPAFHLNQTNTKKQSIDGAVETSNYKSGLMGQDLPWHWALWTWGGAGVLGTVGGGAASLAHPLHARSAPGPDDHNRVPDTAQGALGAPSPPAKNRGLNQHPGKRCRVKN